MNIYDALLSVPVLEILCERQVPSVPVFETPRVRSVFESQTLGILFLVVAQPDFRRCTVLEYRAK